jgi:NAD(P)-dependent dehydrogenase (short-subunit alcohol dehydrogenase family)
VLITGAGRGLGHELARQYAQHGWHVIACSRTQPADGYEGSTEFQPLDVADPASISDLAARLAGRPVDILINNAGVRSSVAGLDHFEPDEFLEVMATNTLGPVLMTRAVRANLRLGRTRVVANIGSLADGITVLSLHPGWVRTDMGGELAVLPVADSAFALRTIIAAAKPECNGSFRAFDGRQVGW